MKLVSKIHDYYDGVVHTTKQDESLVFVREQRFINENKIWRSSQRRYSDKKFNYTFHFDALGFCGALYPFVKVDEYPLNNIYHSGKADNSVTYYDTDSFFDVFKGMYNEKRKWTNLSDIRSDVIRWLDKGEDSYYWGSTRYSLQQDNELKNFFQKEKVVYFVTNGRKGRSGCEIQIYPILQDYMFYKKFDAYTTYQMIEMFLNNQLVQHDNRQVIIPDVLKAQSKGFDKWSFRKMPDDK